MTGAAWVRELVRQVVVRARHGMMVNPESTMTVQPAEDLVEEFAPLFLTVMRSEKKDGE